MTKSVLSLGCVLIGLGCLSVAACGNDKSSSGKGTGGSSMAGANNDTGGSNGEDNTGGSNNSGGASNTGGQGGDSSTGGNDGTGGGDNEGGPSTDWENPVELEVDEPFSADIARLSQATQDEAMHFFSFTPSTTAIHVLTLVSPDNPYAYISDQPDGDVACVPDNGCCIANGSSCSTDLFEGQLQDPQPLQAGETYTIVVAGDFTTDTSYTLTITVKN